MEDIVNTLVKLGFQRNDARVYLSLLQLGKSKPVEISKRTNIVRARVYDSLKRLEKKGFVDREAVQRAPLYFAKTPEIVFSKIKENLQKKLEFSEDIIEKINKEIKTTKTKESFAIKGVSNVKATIEDIILNSEKEISFLITPDYTKNVDEAIFKLLLTKIQKQLKINILLKIEEENLPVVKKLIDRGVKVYHWSITEEIPIGLYTSDSKITLITVIGSWTKYYKHDIGFLIYGPAQQHKGFEFLVNWYFSACKSGEGRCKELEGDQNG